MGIQKDMIDFPFYGREKRKINLKRKNKKWRTEKRE